MAEDPLAQAARLLEQAFALINSSADPLAALLVAEGVSRRADRAKIAQIAAIDRDGTLASKGYKTTTDGLKDLLSWDSDVARQHVRVAQHVGPRFALDGTPLEPVLPVTAAAFATSTTTMRHRHPEVHPTTVDDRPVGTDMTGAGPCHAGDARRSAPPERGSGLGAEPRIYPSTSRRRNPAGRPS
jgi:hypothetical protein